MPINRKEFESAELDPSFGLEEFLRSNADSAYNVDELIVYMASKKIALTQKEVQDIMSALEGDGRVNLKIVRDVVYYIYRKPNSYRQS